YEALQRLDFPLLRLKEGLGGRWRFRSLMLLDEVKAGFDLVPDVLRHQSHFFDYLMLIVEFAESVPQFAVELLETGVEPGAFGPGGAVLPLGVRVINLLVCRADQRDEFAQGSEMGFVVNELLVQNDPVKPFFGRLANQLFGQGDVLLG